MPLSSANFVPSTGRVAAQDMLNYYNLFTGVMTDQPVHFGNTLQTDGNVGVSTPPPSVSKLMVGGAVSLVTGSNYGGMALTLGGVLSLCVGTADPPTARWQIQTTGHLIAVADNTYDIGTAGSNRPRNLFLGGNATVGGNGTVNGTLQVTGALTQTGAASFGSTVLLAADPTLALQAATKQYVDAGLAPKITQAQADARYLQLTGGSLSGGLTVTGTVAATTLTGNGAVPVGGASGQVLTKSAAADYALGWTTPFTQAAADARYLTPATAATLYLPLTGGTLSGPGNLSVAGTLGVTGAITGAGQATLGASVYTPRSSGINWGSLNPPDRITVWSDSNMYIDTNAGNINMRPGGASALILDTSHNATFQGTVTTIGLTVNGNAGVTGNLQVNGNINGGVPSAGQIAANVIQSGNQFNWSPDGAYMIVSGGYIYLRCSGGVGNGIVVQTTGGSNAMVNCAGVMGNGAAITVDQGNGGYAFCMRDTNVRIFRPVSANYMILASYDSNWVFQDASGNFRYQVSAASGQADHYAINGSTNHRFFHQDGSWCGTQAANFQVQSALRNKLDVRAIQDRALALICEPTLRGVGYTVRSDGSQRVGFIADAWQEFLPEAVGLDRDTGEVQTFDYDQVVPILWEVVRRLAQEMGLCR
jgi:hypothetical protein